MIYALNARILHDNCPKNIFPIFFWGGGLCPTAPIDPPFLCLWVVIGPRDNGFPGPAVALNRHGPVIPVSITEHVTSHISTVPEISGLEG